jgi:hypothetical protein
MNPRWSRLFLGEAISMNWVRQFAEGRRCTRDFIGSCAIANHATETEIAHSTVDHLWLARSWAVAQTIVRRTQKRAAFYNLARDVKLGLHWIVAQIRRQNARIRDGPTTGLDLSLAIERDEPVGGPFPDITAMSHKS